MSYRVYFFVSSGAGYLNVSCINKMNEKNSENSNGVIQTVVDTAKGFLEKLASPPIEEVGGLLADTVRYYRFKNQINILNKAKSILDKSNISPKEVSLKTLVPILESGSLEEDDAMIDRWAALLASAASPEKHEIVKPSFPEILKQLSPREAQILDGIYDMIKDVPIPREEWAFRGATADTVKKIFSISDQEYELAVDNLFRLRLLLPPSTQLGFIDNDHRFQLHMKDIICMTELGYQFITSCRINS